MRPAALRRASARSFMPWSRTMWPMQEQANDCNFQASLLTLDGRSTDDGKRVAGARSLLSGLRRTADPLHMSL
jgi:ketosteroid isomerase-like protein